MPAYSTDSTEPRGHRDWILTAVLIGLAILALYLPVPAQEWIATGIRTTALRPFVVLQEVVVATRQRAVEVEALRSRNDSLVAILVGTHALAQENRHLRDLLGLAERIGPSFKPATVLRAGTRGSESVFMLDLGSEDGVRVGAPVVTRDGLLGIVRETQARTSVAIDWTHPDFRASAMVADGATFGIVQPERETFRGAVRLELDGADFHTRLQEGALVVTSGEGVLPRGIALGTIEGLARTESGWRKSHWLRPAVQPGSATHVLVGLGERAEGEDLSSAWPSESLIRRLADEGRDTTTGVGR